MFEKSTFPHYLTLHKRLEVSEKWFQKKVAWSQVCIKNASCAFCKNGAQNLEYFEPTVAQLMPERTYALVACCRGPEPTFVLGQSTNWYQPRQPLSASTHLVWAFVRDPVKRLQGPYEPQVKRDHDSIQYRLFECLRRLCSRVLPS